MAFVDWITIQQSHDIAMMNGGKHLPLLNSGFIVSLSRNEKGELEEDYTCHKRLMHEGSYSTRVQLSCDGRTVKFSGNIGRLNREDNVFNLSIEQSIDKLNALVVSKGLPPFTFKEPKYMITHDDKLSLMPHFGAEITRLDLACNYITGKGNAQSVIDYLSTKSIGHVKNGRTPDGHTVYWGRKGGRRYTKAYIKHVELLAHAKGKEAKDAMMQSQIYDYCFENGIVRLEIELDRKTLLDNEMRFGVGLNMENLNRMFEERINEILPTSSINMDRFDVDLLPNPVKSTAILYFNKADVAQILSRATFFRHAKILRSYGIDISIPYKDQKTFQPIIKHITLNKVTELPSWYCLYGSVASNSSSKHMRVVSGGK